MIAADTILSPARRTAVALGHLCATASACLFDRVPLPIFLALLAASLLLLWVGHGGVRGPALTHRERIVLLGGLMGVFAICWSAHYWQAASASAWWPRQPVLVWFAVCGAAFDLSRLFWNRRA